MRNELRSQWSHLRCWHSRSWATGAGVGTQPHFRNRVAKRTKFCETNRDSGPRHNRQLGGKTNPIVANRQLRNDVDAAPIISCRSDCERRWDYFPANSRCKTLNLLGTFRSGAGERLTAAAPQRGVKKVRRRAIVNASENRAGLGCGRGRPPYKSTWGLTKQGATTAKGGTKDAQGVSNSGVDRPGGNCGRGTSVHSLSCVLFINGFNFRYEPSFLAW